jgi:hypothetical protein
LIIAAWNYPYLTMGKFIWVVVEQAAATAAATFIIRCNVR